MKSLSQTMRLEEMIERWMNFSCLAIVRFPRCRSKVSNALATPGREQERFTVTPKGGTDSSKIYRFLSSFI